MDSTMSRACRLGLLLSVLGLCALPGQGETQLLVQDNANLVQNIVQAVQLVISVANQALELTRLGSIALDATYTADLDELTGIIQQAQGLAWDFKQLQVQIDSLFSLQTAPTSTRQLQQRLTQIRQLSYDTYVYALKTQSLMSTTVRTVRRLATMTAAISKLVGNMQGNQTATQLEGTLNESLARLEVHTAAYERAMSMDKLAEPLMHKSMENITGQVMADWPRRRP